MSSSNAEDPLNGPGVSRRFNWRHLIRTLIGFLIIFGFCYYLWANRDQFHRMLDASVWHLSGLCVLIVLSWYVNGLQAYVVYRAVGIPIGAMEATMLTTAGTFGNYLPMRAGTIARAMYLKEKHGLGFARFGGIMLLRTLLTVVAAGIVGLASLGLAYWEDGSSISSQLFVVFSLLTIVPVLAMYIPIPKWSWLPHKLYRLADDLTGAFDELRRKPAIAFQVVVLIVVQYFLLGLRFIVSADALSVDMLNSHLVLMAPLAALMSFAALTPGGLGLREAVMGYVSLSLGFSFSIGIFVGTIDRAVLLVMVGVFGGLAFRHVWKQTLGKKG